MKKKILILSGGISKERLISLDTGLQVAKELKKNGYKVKIFEPDSNLAKNPTNKTIKAFETFNFTFLVHSALEKDKPISINWLEDLGFTSNNLKRTQAYRK